ncbi:hypothetical protein LGN17_35705 [Burkholderia sp. AU30280]|nr:hypothetical protein [Burkholderia sp. AU30280]MCA8277832.1 hypothetical protein [Burkholderia sp. AU30280]
MRMHDAVANQPVAVKPDPFAPFITDVEVARHAPLPTRADLRGTSMALAADTQLHWTTLRAALAPEPPGEPGVPSGSAPCLIKSDLERRACQPCCGPRSGHRMRPS